MTNYEFIVWLEGFLDLCGADALTVRKLRIIRNHLNLARAVDGKLGPVNTEIYEMISRGIEAGAERADAINAALKEKVGAFFAETFPESVVTA